MKICFKLKYIFSIFIIFELWCIRTLLRDVSVNRRGLMRRAIRLPEVVIIRPTSPAIIKSTSPTPTAILSSTSAVPSVIQKHPQTPFKKENLEYLLRHKTKPVWRPIYRPHVKPKRVTTTPFPSTNSNFSYPSDIDFRSMYEEFRTTGLMSKAVEPINPHRFRYLHTSHCKCETTNNISLVILVKSAVRNAHLRKSIRITWGNTTEYKNVRIVFMLGYNASAQRAVDTEAKIYGDIVQESFIDAYMNNTYKTIMTFNWAVEHCSHATHFAFIDDDLYLIMPNLFHYIMMHRDNKTPDMVGLLNVNAKVFRNITQKWFMSEEEYPFKYWPPYLSGGIFMVAPDVARRFVFSFPYVRYMGIDDCYLGIVAYKWGIKVSDEKKLNLLNHDVFKDPYQIAYHDFKSETAFKKVWDYLRTRHQKKIAKSKDMRSQKRFVRKPGFGSNAYYNRDHYSRNMPKSVKSKYFHKTLPKPVKTKYLRKSSM